MNYTNRTKRKDTITGKKVILVLLNWIEKSELGCESNKSKRLFD